MDPAGNTVRGAVSEHKPMADRSNALAAAEKMAALPSLRQPCYAQLLYGMGGRVHGDGHLLFGEKRHKRGQAYWTYRIYAWNEQPRQRDIRTRPFWPSSMTCFSVRRGRLSTRSCICLSSLQETE